MNYHVKDIGSVLSLFETTQAGSLPDIRSSQPSLAAVGSVAESALASPLLRESLSDAGVTDYRASASENLRALTERTDWSLALVLSPHKLDGVSVCDTLTPAAKDARVVDTIIRGADGSFNGVNTNAFGVAHAVNLLMSGAAPGRVLILGTGATSRAAVVGLRQQYGEAVSIGVAGRSEERTRDLAEALHIDVAEDVATFEADLVLNCTTVGETSDTPISLPFESALVTGGRFFDLNNRGSQLQSMALARGCVTISGTIMQLTVNALRAYLLSRPPREVAR